jgi:hypothetical protein
LIQTEESHKGIFASSPFKLSLLAKWHWGHFQHDRPLWKEVFVAKFGESITHQIEWVGVNFPYYSSSWWKDIKDLKGL